MVDALVVISTPALSWTVGAFYEDFRQVSDEDVCRIQRAAKAAASTERSSVAGP